MHRRNDRTEPLRRRRDALPRVRRCMSPRFFWPLLRTRSCAIGAEAFPPARFFTRSACTVFSACLVVFCQAPVTRIRDPNSILVFFHFPSYLTCPSSVLSDKSGKARKGPPSSSQPLSS